MTSVCVFSPAICIDLTTPTNGMIAYDMGTMDARPLNTVATYTLSCDTGYMPGDITRVCVYGTWSGSDSTCECESIQCGYIYILIIYFIDVFY